MKVLIVHNAYRHQGGEDAVVRSEADLLKSQGETVEVWVESNERLGTMSLFQKMQAFASLSWNRSAYLEMKERLRRFQPDIVHCHNIFYLLTPAVYDACHDAGVPVVQSQHNFRPFCCNGLFLREGRTCELCREGNFWHGVRYRCFQDSLLRSALFSWALARCRGRGVWRRVDRFIVASEFTKAKCVASGLSNEKISVKPHFVSVPQEPLAPRDNYMLYVGRLSQEKGLDVLLKACRNIRDVPLRIVGSGPLEEDVREAIRVEGLDQIKMLGFLGEQEFDRVFRAASFLVLPSLCYENFPRVVAEAYAAGLPIVASRLGSMQELVRDGQTGRLFTPGDEKDLALKIRSLVEDPGLLEKMQVNARQEYVRRYSPERNYSLLKDIYQQVIRDTSA